MLSRCTACEKSRVTRCCKLSNPSFPQNSRYQANTRSKYTSVSNLIVTVRRHVEPCFTSIYEDTLWLWTRSWTKTTEEKSFVEFGTRWPKCLKYAKLVGSANIFGIPGSTCIPTATHHKLRPSMMAKDKEEAKLVHDRGHHTPDESAQLGNCSLPRSSRNSGSSFVVTASRVMFDGDRHRGRMMRQRR